MAHLPPHLSIQIQSEIKSSGFSSQKIAEAVLKLSDHYQNQDSTTPWENPLTSIA